MAYDDGSEVEIETLPEDPPSSGEWVDPEDFIDHPTADEVAMGGLLGEQIDVDDDDDNGETVVKAIERLT